MLIAFTMMALLVVSMLTVSVKNDQSGSAGMKNLTAMTSSSPDYVRATIFYF